MSAKRIGSVRTSIVTSEPPETTDWWIAGAALCRGDKPVRRGRPKLQHPRRLLPLRLPPEVTANWRATGPGWQTRMAEALEKSRPERTSTGCLIACGGWGDLPTL